MHLNITAPSTSKAAVVPEKPVAADNDSDTATGKEDDKEKDQPSLEKSATPFAKGDRVRTKATNFDGGEEDNEPFSVQHAAQGNGIWVNGVIKFVFAKKGKEQTYKALFDGDTQLTKTWHSHIEAEPLEADSGSSSSGSSSSEDSRTLTNLGLDSDNDETETPRSGYDGVIPGGDKKRRSSSRITTAKSLPPSSQKHLPKKSAAAKEKPIGRNLKPKMTKKPPTAKDKPKPKKKRGAANEPPASSSADDATTRGTYPSYHPFAISIELRFVFFYCNCFIL